MLETTPHTPHTPGSTDHRDLLSEVVAALRVDHSNLCEFDFGEPWSIAEDDLPISTSWTVVEGTVWVSSRHIEPVAFHAGDTFLLLRGTRSDRIVTASSLDATPQPIDRLWQEAELQGFEIGALTGRRQRLHRRHPQARARRRQRGPARIPGVRHPDRAGAAGPHHPATRAVE